VVQNDRIRANVKIIVCIKTMHKDTKLCVRRGQKEISIFGLPIRRLRNVARVPIYFIIL
jgi:hypothetical protein